MTPKLPPRPTDDNTLFFGEVGTHLDQLLVAMPSLVEREPHELLRQTEGFREFLHLQLLGGVWLHKLVRFATASIPPDPMRKPELSAALFPTLRSQLELLMTLMYLFEDHPRRFEQYQKAGWARAVTKYERDKEEWDADPTMVAYLDAERRFVEFARKRVTLTAGEERDRRRIGRWPNPGGFAKNATTPKLRHVLGKLDHWLYDELSGAAHFTFRGTLDVGVVIRTLEESHGEDWEARALHHRSIAGSRSIGLVLATLSEVEMLFRFGRGPKLALLWDRAAKKVPLIEALYRLRWKEELAAFHHDRG